MKIQFAKPIKIGLRKIIVCLVVLYMTFSTTGCSTSDNLTIMPAMLQYTSADDVEYNTVEAVAKTFDKKITVAGSVKYNTTAKVFFKTDRGHLKAVYVKKLDEVKKGDLLAELNTDALDNELSQKMVELQKAKLAYEELQTESEISGGGAGSGLENAKLNIDSINLEIDKIENDIEASKLVSPISGIVAFVEILDTGNYVTPYETFVEVCVPDDIVIISKAVNSSGIYTGMKAEIEYAYYENGKKAKKEFTGTVLQVCDIDDDKKHIDSFQPFGVIVKPDKMPAIIGVDSSVDITLTVGILDNIVVIPRDAMFGGDDDKYVKILQNGKVIKRDIETGCIIDELKLVEVTSGLCEGEKVIISPDAIATTQRR